MAKAEPRCITRRAILSGGAGLAAVSLPVEAIAASATAAIPAPRPDPIFAAIAEHVQAYDAFIRVLGDLAAAERAAWDAPRGTRRAAKRRLRLAYAAEARFSDLEAESVQRFIATVPETLHGVAMALRHVREGRDGYPLWDDESAMTFIASIERAVCHAAGLSAP